MLLYYETGLASHQHKSSSYKYAQTVSKTDTDGGKKKDLNNALERKKDTTR